MHIVQVHALSTEGAVHLDLQNAVLAHLDKVGLTDLAEPVEFWVPAKDAARLGGLDSSYDFQSTLVS